MQDLGVAGVRRLAAENTRRHEAAADDLVEVDVGEEAGAGPAGVRADEHRPETRGLRFALKLAHQRFGSVIFAREGPLVRVNLGLHEGRKALAALVHIKGRRECGHRRDCTTGVLAAR